MQIYSYNGKIDVGPNSTSNLPKHANVHHSRNYQNMIINFHRRTRRLCRCRWQHRNDMRMCSIKIFDNEQARSGHRSSYSRSESPSVAESITAATASRSDIHDVTHVTDWRWQYAYCIYCHLPNRFTTGRDRGRGRNRELGSTSMILINIFSIIN